MLPWVSSFTMAWIYEKHNTTYHVYTTQDRVTVAEIFRGWRIIELRQKVNHRNQQEDTLSNLSTFNGTDLLTNYKQYDRMIEYVQGHYTQKLSLIQLLLLLQYMLMKHLSFVMFFKGTYVNTQLHTYIQMLPYHHKYMLKHDTCLQSLHSWILI